MYMTRWITIIASELLKGRHKAGLRMLDVRTKSLMEGTLPEKRFTALMVLGPPVQDENIKYFRARLYSTMLINEHVGE